MSGRRYKKEARLFLDLIWERRIHRNNEVDLKGLCALLNLSEMQVPAMCKQNFNMIFLQVFRHCRVAEVKQELIKPEYVGLKPVKVAKEAGYAGRTDFHVSFKDVTGMSPTEFRHFHYHFKRTTGVGLAEYQQEEAPVYLPDDRKPTFLSNFLNKLVKKL